MAGAFVNEEKRHALEERMLALGIREADLEETFIRGSGPGGQKINKTSSCVRLRHPATAIEIRCQASRYRELNRFTARRMLCERVAEKVLGERTKRQQEAEKVRRQKRRRSRRQQQRVLADKHHQGERKVRRRRVDSGDAG